MCQKHLGALNCTDVHCWLSKALCTFSACTCLQSRSEKCPVFSTEPARSLAQTLSERSYRQHFPVPQTLWRAAGFSRCCQCLAYYSFDPSTVAITTWGMSRPASLRRGRLANHTVHWRKRPTYSHVLSRLGTCFDVLWPPGATRLVQLPRVISPEVQGNLEATWYFLPPPALINASARPTQASRREGKF